MLQEGRCDQFVEGINLRTGRKVRNAKNESMATNLRHLNQHRNSTPLIRGDVVLFRHLGILLKLHSEGS